MNLLWKRATPSAVAVVVEEPAKAKAPIPTSGPVRKPSLDDAAMEEYAKVSAAVGIDCCTDLTRERLVRCLREENIHVFSTTQVVAYLDDKLGLEWEWRGLRKLDAKHMPDGTWSHTVGERKIKFAGDVYRGAVPLPVLLTVQKIQAHDIPDIYFYVSARKDEDGDPFLMITSRWLGVYVVERWDEPNFRER